MGPVGFGTGGKQHPEQRLEASIVVLGWCPAADARGVCYAALEGTGQEEEFRFRCEGGGLDMSRWWQ